MITAAYLLGTPKSTWRETRWTPAATPTPASSSPSSEHRPSAQLAPASVLVHNGRVTVDIDASVLPERDELGDLYGAVGWVAYTNNLDALDLALRSSSRVVTARRDGHLVGLARVISDGATIAYLQDIVVHPDEQRGGLGRRLVAEALRPFESVRQKVLLTDDEPGQRAFYESLGFTEIRDLYDGSLRAFVQFG